MHQFFDFKTLNTSLKLTEHDRLFLYLFNQANHIKKLELIRNQKIETIARIAYHFHDVEIFCNVPELKEYWEKIWCAYGVALSQQKNIPLMMFFSQPQLNPFDLVRGAYFFHFSQEVRKNMERDFGFSEIESIKIAIRYGSVHAIQRYNEYIYHKLEQASPEESHMLYQELITNSKLMLPHYGSYGYMVLAYAISHYCIWLLNNFEVEKAQAEYRLVLELLDNAELILKESYYSIQNASIGQGLKCSNFLGFELPSQAKDFFIEYYDKSLESTKVSDSIQIQSNSL
ncbi:MULTISPECIES: DUF5630 domain-containing protein [Legionella]|uniref:DUF5630 domain-containing protein n=1 Tax=Legionella resiliens TaxID=2905958 RepID=A0ABS8X2Q9_9GAMM|nr:MULTISPECIES: DUF5630 domain-containing protein [unclassified Legionella]MCE0722878.1 DUF5630 domain-containing protein [Legionella sp. 9fVS26]MCE3532031.1 DUF5630 domain-containing protein [Legionella sp. 8cVS16]QLZ68150.1 hypothetical protein FOLKNPGA_00928 [Legionella sp. PC1000]